MIKWQNCVVLRWMVLMVLVTNITCWDGISSIKSFFEPITCRFGGECCTDAYIKLDRDGLQRSLETRVYGQHLSQTAILNHFSAQDRNVYTTKALSLSFNGGTGTGKNLVSRIIAESIYRKGMKSKFVHLIASTNEFPHPQKVNEYKEELKEKIEKSVSKCERSMFIFDEIDKMPAGLLDVIKPYLDFYEDLNGVNYRRSTFLFLSNTGSRAIQQRTITHWREGLPREQLRLVDMEKLIIRQSVNEKGKFKSGLWHSGLLLHQMVSAHIPFLPLERKHIRQCIIDCLIARKYFPNRDKVVDRDVREIASQLSYYPEKEQLFSITGCKRVSDKVDFVMADDLYDKYKEQFNI
ncbi:torsin-1A-like [Ylistrum balloti]|uniref:torsin-1A-like n=1 Tax=Ylistrum balloti TaxID=509963 RepID=UPI002905F7A7|nr:torsin-1A-like [Ylistrum balloti]